MKLLRHFTFIPFFLVYIFCGAQTNLLPSIGIATLPSDADPISTIPIYTGSFSNTGYNVGDTVPDFTLYAMNDQPVSLGDQLALGKPVLLIAGAYTCPVFRGLISEINDIASNWDSLLSTFIVYVVEAHPTDTSPYSGTIWTTSANQNAGVLYPQATTYGARKAVINDMLTTSNITAEILLDGPGNEWWSHYGPAPNNSYIIGTDGIVLSKHAWFHKQPDDIYCEIDSIFGVNTGSCNTWGNQGQFTWLLDADSMATGPVGATLAVHGTLTNTSASDNVPILMRKLQKNYPAGWESALCADICYQSSVDSATIVLVPSEVQPFTFYFYTDSIPATGYCRVGFRNSSNQSNAYALNIWGATDPVNGVYVIALNDVRVFPNPARDHVEISGLPGETEQYRFSLWDHQGRLALVDQLDPSGKVDLSTAGLAPGAYAFTLSSHGLVYAQGRIMVE